MFGMPTDCKPKVDKLRDLLYGSPGRLASVIVRPRKFAESIVVGIRFVFCQVWSLLAVHYAQFDN